MSDFEIIDRIAALLKEKKLKNKNYSLRSYARYLNINPSVLSRLLNKKIPITNKMLLRLQNKINISDDELCLLQQKLINERLNPKNKWGLDTFFDDDELEKFYLLQRWYYLPIIELCNLYPYDLKAELIAKNLKINHSEAVNALKILKKNKILSRSKDKKWRATLGFQALLEKNLFSSAMKARQREVLHKAAEDVAHLNDREFEQCSFAMAIDQDLIPEAKRRIHNFKKKLALDLAKKSKSKNRVYEFSVSLFPLSEKTE